MYYVSRVVVSRGNMTIYIMDTDDGVEERVSMTNCRKLLEAGVEVKGLSLAHGRFITAEAYTPPTVDSARSAIISGYQYSTIDDGLRSLTCVDPDRCKRVELGALAGKILASSIDVSSFNDVTFVVDDRVRQFSPKATRGFGSSWGIRFDVSQCTNDKILRNVYALCSVSNDAFSVDDKRGRYINYRTEADIFYGRIGDTHFTTIDDEGWFLTRNKQALLDLCDKIWDTSVPKSRGDKGLTEVMQTSRIRDTLTLLKKGLISKQNGLDAFICVIDPLESIFSFKGQPLRNYITMGGHDSEICYRYAKVLWLLYTYAINAKNLLYVTSDYTWDSLRAESFFVTMNRVYSQYFYDAPHGEMGAFS